MPRPEEAFQKSVIDLARIGGFAVAHFRPAQTVNGWRTPVSADGAGFPDLVLVKPGVPILFRELKSDKGRLNANQEAWGTLIQKAGGDWSVWRPSDIERICEELGVQARSLA